MREANIDGFGKYEERTWAVPVGVGVKMRPGGGFDARVGAVMHFSATDFIDGVSDKASANAKATRRTTTLSSPPFRELCSEHGPESQEEEIQALTLSPEEMDAIAFNDDEDGDGVMDWSDHCPHTTKVGVAVDANGCPLDTDLTACQTSLMMSRTQMAGAPVNARGVTISDDEFLARMAQLFDSATSLFITSAWNPSAPFAQAESDASA
ncbi:MAG: hypothetical protein IPL86_07585 [Flavobacteriales bacterium]|nr:hypothetical protein [Flavobacteriales bacterium]